MTFAILAGKNETLRTVRVGRAVHNWTAFVAGGFMLLNAILHINALAMPQIPEWLALVHTVVHYSGILVLGAIGIIVLRSKIVTTSASTPKRILAIGAHPDDLEIACGATLSKLRDAGHIVYGLVLTQGEAGGDQQVRSKEAAVGGAFMGLNIVEVKHFTDTRLSEESNAISSVIEGIITRFRPDVVLTHSANDQHQDHVAVHLATLRAARNQSTILCYESPSVTRMFSPTVFVDVSEYLDVKLESIRFHRDQRTKRYVQGAHVRGVAAFRGGQAKTTYAEGFEAVRLLSSSVADF